MNNDHTIWVEKYRPATIDEYVGNETVRAKLAEYIEKQDIPHLLFHGPAGTGKTTAAKMLVNNIECDIMFINASDERGIDTIRDKVKAFASTIGFKPLKIVVLDEMDAITPDAQRALRNLMEAFSASTRFILTANYIERIIDPLISRAQVYKLVPPSKKEVAKKLVNILTKEQVQYETEVIIQIVNAYYPDIRKVINTAQLQTQDGELTVSADTLITQDVKLKIVEILSNSHFTLEKVKQIRQLIADNSITDFIELYSLLYEYVEIYSAPSKIPQTVIALAEGMFRDAQVPDKELNFAATLYNILIN